MRIQIRDVHFKQSSPEDQRTGLLGWISCTLNDLLVLNGIALRRSREGRLYFSFPARKDGHGILRHYFSPAHEDARKALEKRILSILDLPSYQGRRAC